MDEFTLVLNLLTKGKIIVFPTDTAYGIGCRMDNINSVENLFLLRRRPVSQATPVLVSSIKMASKYLRKLDDKVQGLMETYWPGALTIVYPCITNKVPYLVRGGGNNLGVRMPANDYILSLVDRLGVPILGPSANFHGDPTPYSYNDLNPKMVRMADYVIKGDCPVGKASTVIDCSVKTWHIVRDGIIKIKTYEKK